MAALLELTFIGKRQTNLSLPERCSLDVSCFEDADMQRAIAAALEESLCEAAGVGIDLKALDGITVSSDCAATASAMQNLDEGQVPLEMGAQPDSMEMARTAAVRRDGGLRFHIVLRTGLGLMTVAPAGEMRRLAQACIAHEAAHVEHESHLYRTFPESFANNLNCGDRSKQTFLKAMDVWSEYAACRSSAMFRPEAQGEFEGALCRAVYESFPAAATQVKAHRDGKDAALVFRELQQVFGDVFISAGYFLGCIHGLERSLAMETPELTELFRCQPKFAVLMKRLERVLRELWLKEFAWASLDVFAPIYDLICEMMAQHGLVFVKHEDEWRIVMYEDNDAVDDARLALSTWRARKTNH